MVFSCGYYLLFVFFFSSRRRHTRWPRDWSSDVCSSDLDLHRADRPRHHPVDHRRRAARRDPAHPGRPDRSEEHTSELQSRGHLVCRLLLEKKKNYKEYVYRFMYYQRVIGIGEVYTFRQ